VNRAAIFGSRGQLGVELASVLSKRSYEVASYDRASVNITDAAAVEKVIVGFRPSVVLNPAAYNQVDLAESNAETAFQINGLAVRNIALAARNAGAQLVHFSTDYVFDGLAGRPYGEDDATHPLGAYAVSKLAGELYAQAYIESPLVIRTCGVFGPEGIRTARGNFVEMMLKLAKGEKPVRVVEDFVVSPTYAPALAERTADLLERGITGVLHIGGGLPISWYDWAKMIFAAAGITANLQATNSSEFPTAARRPKFSALSNAKMESLGIAPMPKLEDALKDYFSRREPLVMRETV
jgi:dTDP-4-dehydrorhamnose reductase